MAFLILEVGGMKVIFSLVNILATDPVSFPTPTVEGTCFLPQFFARACGLGEELISICTKIGA